MQQVKRWELSRDMAEKGNSLQATRGNKSLQISLELDI